MLRMSLFVSVLKSLNNSIAMIATAQRKEQTDPLVQYTVSNAFNSFLDKEWLQMLPFSSSLLSITACCDLGHYETVTVLHKK